MKKILTAAVVLSLMTAVCLNVSAADLTASSSSKDSAASSTVEDTDSTASTAKDSKTSDDSTATDSKASTDSTNTDSSDSALEDAKTAYRAAVRDNEIADFEDELKDMVTAGQLTQDQADLLLEAVKSETDDTTGKHGIRHGNSVTTADTDTDDTTADDASTDTDSTGKHGKKGSQTTSDSSTSSDAAAASDSTSAKDTTSTDPSATDSTATSTDSTDSTALEEAWEAYRTAKQENRLSDYEAALKDMVAAGQLTQDQADLLLEDAKDKAENSASHDRKDISDFDLDHEASGFGFSHGGKD